MIIQGTTPTIPITVKDDEGKPYDLDGCTNVRLAISDGKTCVVIPKQQIDVDGATITAHLTQVQTLALDQGAVKLQLRFCVDGNIMATLEAETTVHEILDRAVM